MLQLILTLELILRMTTTNTNVDTTMINSNSI